MHTLSASLESVAPGLVEIALTPGSAVSQQHGFVHAGALAVIANSAAGYAALSLMPPGAGVLMTEFKINLLAPAAGERIVARGRVIKAGRVLSATPMPASVPVAASACRSSVSCSAIRRLRRRSDTRILMPILSAVHPRRLGAGSPPRWTGSVPDQWCN
jgi:uncharacterized protein (TIGR00369 family)